MERIVLIPDLHCADQDDRAVELACKVIEAARPSRLIFLGDILDYGWASFYPQNQGELRGIFRREIAAWEKVASRIRLAAPAATADLVPGNHDYRLQKGFLWSHPAFQEWEELEWKQILKLDSFNIKLHEDPAAVFLAGRNFVATHGVRVAQHSGASAIAELDREWWCSGASGHTHRMGQVFRTVHRGVYCWTECGHLQKRRPKYAPINKVSPMNWQQGIAIMGATKTEFRVPELIPFWQRGSKYRARWHDSEFEA